MKDFSDQGEKNGIKLLNFGKYQFCGGEFEQGVLGCVTHLNN